MKEKLRVWSYIIRAIIAIAIIVFFIKWFNLGNALSSLAKINPWFIVLSLFTVFVINIAKMFRFYYLARDLNINLGLKETILAHLVAPIVGRATPAKLGEGVKIYFLKKDPKKLGFTFIMEKLADIITILIIAFFAIYAFGSYYNAYVTLTFLLVLIVVVLFNIEKVLNFVFRKNILEDQWFRNLLYEISPRQWICFGAYSTIIRFLIMSVPYIMATALGIPTSMWMLFQLYAISLIIGNLSGLPGGIGSRELTFSFLLLHYAMLSKETAGILALLVVATDLITEGLLALTGIIWYGIEKRSSS